jgi:hypothetical protein
LGRGGGVLNRIRRDRGEQGFDQGHAGGKFLRPRVLDRRASGGLGGSPGERV